MSARNPVTGLRDLLRPGPDVRPEEGSLPPRAPVVLAATLVVGALVLAWTLRLPSGDGRFYLGTLATALVWGCGAVVCGAVRAGAVRAGVVRAGVVRAGAVPGVAPGPLARRRSTTVLGALILGLLLVGIFAVVALVVARVPALAGPVRHLLAHANAASLPLVALLTAVNGVAEELFFRGALYAGLRRHEPLLVTTVLYAVVTATSGVPLLVLAAAIIGTVAGLQRRVSGGVLAPAVTHVTWSLGMLLLLPPLLDAAG
jgi:membrane protease YdiL (CAAX protease family)